MIEAQHRCLTIAIIDDDPGLCRSLFRFFEAYGFAPDTFLSAEEFLADAEINSFACIVLDVQLGGMSGIELFETLKQRECETPIIFLSALEELELPEWIRRRDDYTFFNKNVTGKDVIAAVRAKTGKV